MIPMRCLGIQPDRLVTGTDRIWEGLSRENNSGFLVFMFDDGTTYISFPLSADMYAELPDTTVILSGSIPAGELIRYPSCRGSADSGVIYLVSPLLTDCVVKIYPELIDGNACYDLAAEPVWLACNKSTVLLGDNLLELVFTSRNISLERADRALEAKLDNSLTI